MTREARVIGTFMFVLGLFALYLGARFLLSGEQPIADGTSCKAICGFILLFSEFFGREAGRIAGGALWLIAGVIFCMLGRAVLRRREPHQ